MLSKFKIGSDGRTPYERITKHRCKHLIVGFGESVLWQQIPVKTARDKLEGDWRDGVFLGVIWRTTEYLVGTADGIFKCRTIKTKVAGNSYDPDCIDDIATSYNEYVLGGAKSQGARARFADPGASPGAGSHPQVIRAGNEFVPRRVYLKPFDFNKYGFTEGCPGCTWLQNMLGNRRGHNDACRDRMTVCMADNDDDRHRVDAQKSKMDTFAAAEGLKHMEKEDAKVQEQVVQDDEDVLHTAPEAGTEVRFEPIHATPLEVELDARPVAPSEPRLRSPVRAKAQKRRGVNPDSPVSTPVVKSSRTESKMMDDSKVDPSARGSSSSWQVPYSSQDLPMPETVEELIDEMSDGARSVDDSMLSVDILIAARAILGSDMIECISEATARRIVEECQSLLAVDVMEVYSPERVAKLCAKYDLKPGSSLDLTNGYDFDNAGDRQKAWETVTRDQPLLIVWSPPCTYFSILNELTKSLHKDKPGWMKQFEHNLAKARRHVKFCCTLYQHQIDCH